MDIPITVGSEVCFFARGSHQQFGIEKHDMILGKVTEIKKHKSYITVRGIVKWTEKGFSFERTYKEGVIPETYTNNYDCGECCWLCNPYAIELL